MDYIKNDSYQITDFDSLVNVKNVKLSLGCKNSRDYYFNTNNFRTNMKAKIKSIGLVFNKEEFSDIECLRGVGSIALIECTNIINVSPLGESCVVELSNLNQIIDVSSISNVKEIKIKGCSGITDTSSLSNVFKLEIDPKRVEHVDEIQILNFYNSYV